MSELPAGWIRAPLGEIAHISSGGTPNRTRASYWGGDIPWVTTGEIRFNTITDTAEKLTPEGLRQSAAKLFPAGTLLMAMYGQGKTRGQVARLGIEATTNQACAAIQLRSGTDPDYVYQFLANSYTALRELGNAGSQQNLNAGIIRNISVPLPPLHEQTRIARIAGVWDRAIDTTGRLLDNSRHQKRHLMHLLLSRRRSVVNARAHWAQVDFDTVFERITNKNTDGDRNVLTISAQHGLVSQRDYFSRHVASDDLSGYTRLTTGDFAYNRSSSSGYPVGAIKPLVAYDSGVVSGLYICFRQKPGVEVDNDFYRLYFEAGMLNEAITSIAQEGARNHGLLNVSLKDFFKLPLCLPPLDVQRRIAAILRVAEAEERVIVAQRETLREEKRALMRDLLSGRRRVRATAAEPA
ncbi:MAG: restriction endonuclease subunit S [Hydrogenophaga sp.]|uniref:restriction endonuclease subunit S n=1 Tax=Hydrogenophaga sp. TaxID=1904254 RepID=UPI0016900AC3|nr:restriction endonuclease subunit S [Hydrogenophaga sp.]NIM40264.1 restriction endonuclease subunit S [Hydrogenophaga sp.]NIN25495.1 restriction endonuclease subunit S [Hydrogenophaga sp.]NIN30147.1 restriction endonuclease subunit S [Hydrogenophaga sp.]NIN54448.1 restriction endonuclease subunit S [Hydrogenophaga sp.]NIO50321.1 restriction endonuclease subunit S [Hydrogenophaga sp.]